MNRTRTFLLAALGGIALAGCSGGGGDAPPPPDQSLAEDDWSLPAWAVASTNSGFFSESLDAAHHVDVRVIDVTWKQIEPSEMVFDTAGTATLGQDYALTFPSLAIQLASPDPYWLRLWVSTQDAVPDWVMAACPNAKLYGPGYESDLNLGIWDPCVWSKALDAWRFLLETRGLRADPRMIMAYAPGAFTWDEFDFDIVGNAVDAGDLDFPTFHAWFTGAIASLVAIMNGENASSADDFAFKLVYTGEDYPFGPFDTQDDLLARDAVAAGTGIRNGITEEFNFHLNEVPAYGTTIGSDGHLVTDEGAPAFDAGKVRATENECYVDCGFSTATPYYAVKMSDLKALQLRMNWIYVVPGPSFLDPYAAFWEWVRLEIGKNVFDSPDAWVALRDAEDTYWEGADPVLSCGATGFPWAACPYVRNLERWIVQKDVAPDGVAARGTDARTNAIGAPGDSNNGTAWEGLATAGNGALYFDLDDRFLHASSLPVEVKITWRSAAPQSWHVEYAGGAGTTAPVAATGSSAWTTSTFSIADGTFDGSLAGATDLRIVDGGAPLEVRFVRVIKTTPP